MLGLATRLIAGMVTPVFDQLSRSSGRLLRKLALFLVAGLSLIVVLIALTIAFDLWISSLAGPIVGALSVAGVYLAIAIAAIALALRKPRPKGRARKLTETEAKDAKAAKGVDAEIDAFAAPLLAILQRFGFRKEQLAVLAGTSVAKQIGPVPLVGLAIVAGFLIGRMWGGWRGILSSDLVATLLASDVFAGIFGSKAPPERTPADDRD